MTIEQIAVAAFGLVVFTWAANIILFQYARAVTRLAMDEGVRSAAVVGPEAARETCQTAADAAMTNLLRGPLGANISVTCAAGSDVVRATTTGSVPSWVPGLGDHAVDGGAVGPIAEAPS